jgi:Chaperone of endosialidase
MSGVPYTFASATSSIPLSQLDANFATNATLGNATVGLGNTTTTVGNLTVSNVTINGLSGGGANGVVYINSSNVATASSSALVFDGVNLGLGVTPSAWGNSYKALAINSECNFYASSNQGGVTLNAYNDNTNWKYTTSDYATRYAQYQGSHFWQYASSGTAGNAITFTQAMTLDNSGNFFLGTTSQSPNTTGLMTLWQGGSSTKPSIQMNAGNDQNWWGRISANNSGGNLGMFLTQGGSWSVSGTTYSATKDYNGSTPTSAFFIANQINSSNGTQFIWLTKAGGSSTTDGTVTQLMTLDNSGRLGVGAVPNSGGVFGTQKLQVGATGGTSAASLYNNQDGNNNGVETLSVVNGAATATNNFVGWYTTTSITQRGTVVWNGSNMVYSNTSDQRLKENIVDAGSGLAKLSSVQIKSFDFIENKAHVDFGVIAQELHNVAPEAVSVGQDNEDGTMKTPWGVDTSVLVPAMIKAIQELSAQVTTLQSQVAALQAKVGT